MSEKKDKLGRLGSIGIEHYWQIPFVMPHDYHDFRITITNFDGLLWAMQSNKTVLVKGVLKEKLWDLPPGKGPSCKGRLTLEDSSFVYFSFFGNKTSLHEEWDELINSEIALVGDVRVFGENFWLTNNVKRVDIKYAGKVVPVYKGKPKVITPDNVRESVLKNIEVNLEKSTSKIKQFVSEEQIQKIIDSSKLSQVLFMAHNPPNPQTGFRALQILDQLAAFHAINKIEIHKSRLIEGNAPIINLPVDWKILLKPIPFQLTESQIEAIDGIIKALNSPVALRDMLQGDVGSGKTAVYGVVTAAAVWARHRVAIVLPNETLAKQVHKEIMSWYPKIKSAIITGESKEQDLTPYNLVIGTTAILFRDTGIFSLVVVDEQQKFSREQREQLLTGNAHLLEVSATPIPRSVALVKHGAMRVWRIQGGHSNKVITTEILKGEESTRLVYDVNDMINSGHQVIIVYPLVNESEAECMEGIMPVVNAYEKWNKIFPNQVVMAHSEMDSKDKEASITAMKERKANILVATTVIEVGVTIPGVMLLAVIHPERMGLVTLHQLRGRVARNGGHGKFILCMPQDKVSDKTLQRMNVLVHHDDGFEVAELDLQLRGSGDMSIESSTQSGDDTTFLIGRHINMAYVEQILQTGVPKLT